MCRHCLTVCTCMHIQYQATSSVTGRIGASNGKTRDIIDWISGRIVLDYETDHSFFCSFNNSAPKRINIVLVSSSLPVLTDLTATQQVNTLMCLNLREKLFQVLKLFP